MVIDPPSRPTPLPIPVALPENLDHKMVTYIGALDFATVGQNSTLIGQDFADNWSTAEEDSHFELVVLITSLVSKPDHIVVVSIEYRDKVWSPVVGRVDQASER